MYAIILLIFQLHWLHYCQYSCMALISFVTSFLWLIVSISMHLFMHFHIKLDLKNKNNTLKLILIAYILHFVMIEHIRV